MLISVSPIFFLSLVIFTVSLNVPNYLPTRTLDDIHDTAGYSIIKVDSTRVNSAKDRTLNSSTSSHENETTNVFVSSQHLSTDKEFDGDSYRVSENLWKPGNLSNGHGKKWDKVDAFLKLQTRGILQNVNVRDAIRDAKTSDVCKTDIQRYFDSLSDLEAWSVKMADASGKIAGGVLEGRFMYLGSYEECVKVRVYSAEDVEEFRGQYCMVKYCSPLLSDVYLKNGSLNRQYTETYGKPPEWIQDFILRTGPYLKWLVFSFGTCVPSTCSEQDLTQVITHIASPFGMLVEVAGCQVEKPITWTKSLIAAVSALCGITLLCILGTAIDFTKRMCEKHVSEEEKCDHSNHTTMKLWKMFSVPSNIKLLINKDNSDSIGCLNGIRFCTLAWIVLYHSFSMYYPWLFHRFGNVLTFKEDFSDSLWLEAADNVSIAIVSFFFLSGFLMSYLMWKKLEKGNEKVNFVKYFLHKYWRFTPCIALTLALFVVIAHIGSGPLWRSTMEYPMEMCNTNWWKTFLYIANWWENNDMCLIHTWFVSCLMQLHVVGFIIIQVTFRWPTVGVIIGVLIVLGCCALVVTIAVLKHVHLPISTAEKDIDILAVWCSWFRFKPFYYMQSYAIGMVVGYLVLKHKSKTIKQKYQALGWISSVILSIYAVYGIYGPQNSVEFTAFYYGFGFIAWSASLGWLTYACIAGYGGFINRFLSWKGFELLGNLSYLIYLLHFLVIYYYIASLEELVTFGYYEVMSLFLGILAISTFLAFVCHVTVEMPFYHLEKIIL